MAYREESDAGLLVLIAKGNQQALEELYERHSRRALSLALRIVGNRGTAEEVVQDAFTQVWRRASTYQPHLGKVSSWVLSITHHRAIDILRRRRRELTTDTDYEQALEQEAVRLSPGPVDDEAVAIDTADRVRELLRQLSPPQREVLVLAYFYGYTQSEIAKKTKQPLGTVKTRMRSAIIKLRALIGPLEE